MGYIPSLELHNDNNEYCDQSREFKRKIVSYCYDSRSVDWIAFGARLAESITKQRGHRQQVAFAREIGIAPQRLSKFCKGKERPPLGLVVVIAQALGESLDWFLLGKEHKPRPHLSGSEIRQALDEFLESMPDFVIERLLWQTKAFYEVWKIGPEAFPDYVREVWGD